MAAQGADRRRLRGRADGDTPGEGGAEGDADQDGSPGRRRHRPASADGLVPAGALQDGERDIVGAIGPRVARFEACSTFTRVAAHMVAKPPRAARCTGVLQSKSLPPSTAPIATGWSDSCRAGFAPAG